MNENIDINDSDSSTLTAPAAMSAEGLAGYTSEHYTLVERLYCSSSGMMEIHSALRYGRRYILKTIREEYRTDPLARIMLKKEFDISSTLDHPHIRRTLDFITIPELGPAIVMEYVDGEPLDRAIASGRISGASARTVAAQLTDAVAYLHARQCVHRDLKPANILVTFTGGDVKLIDFSLSDSESHVIMKTPAGTRKYIAPEQLLHDAVPSPAADVYSLGLIMCELAAPAADDELMRLGRACAVSDPSGRPSVSSLAVPAASQWREGRPLFSLSSPRLTILLLGIAALLTLIITYLITRHG